MRNEEEIQSPDGVKIHSVKYNIVMNMIMTSSAFLFPLITTPYVSRVLSTTGTGAVAFAQNVANYFSLVALLGVNNYGTNVCAQVRENKRELSRTTKEILALLLVSSALVSVVYFGSLFFVPQFQQERALFTLFAGYIWLTSFGANWFFQALEQYDYITARNIAFKMISLVLMFLFVRAKDDYVIYGAIVVFASGGSNILNMVRLRKLIDLGDTGKLNIRRHLKPMKWFAIAQISSGMYISVDIVMLGFLGTTHMVGLYQLVSRIKAVLVSSVNSVGNVMLPRLAHYKSKGNEEASRRLIAKNINFVTIMGMAIICLLAICSRRIVLIMGGPDFLESTIPLAAAGPAVMFSAMNIVLGNYLISHGMESKWATVNVLGLLFAVLCNIVLIPMFGVLGSAISISACEGIMLIMRTYVCRDFLRNLTSLIDPGKAIISALAASVVVVLVQRALNMQSSIGYIMVAGVVYSVAYLAFLLLCKESLARELITLITKRVHK